MLEWIAQYETVLWWLAVISIITCAVGLVIAPWWIIRLPADYFLCQEPAKQCTSLARHWTRCLVRNFIGCIFILAGLVMLVLPGQGVLTALAGVMIMEFPAKHRVVRAILQRPSVLHTLNWVRRKAGKPALLVNI